MTSEELKKLEATLWQTADTLREDLDFDRLLSRLMSGKIDVENIRFPASMREEVAANG